MGYKLEKIVITSIVAASISFLISVMSYIFIDMFLKASAKLAMRYESVSFAVHLLSKYKEDMLLIIALISFIYAYKHVDEIIEVKKVR